MYKYNSHCAPRARWPDWLEALQECDVDIQQCRYCLRQKERGHVSPTVAAVQTTGDGVLQIVHGSVGGGALRERQDPAPPPRAGSIGLAVNLRVHCCDTCTAQKGQTRRSHAPLQQYLVRAPTE
ncbi:unnamed protein product [Lota lota]